MPCTSIQTCILCVYLVHVRGGLLYSVSVGVSVSREGQENGLWSDFFSFSERDRGRERFSKKSLLDILETR